MRCYGPTIWVLLICAKDLFVGAKHPTSIAEANSTTIDLGRPHSTSDEMWNRRQKELHLRAVRRACSWRARPQLPLSEVACGHITKIERRAQFRDGPP